MLASHELEPGQMPHSSRLIVNKDIQVLFKVTSVLPKVARTTWINLRAKVLTYIVISIFHSAEQLMTIFMCLKLWLTPFSSIWGCISLTLSQLTPCWPWWNLTGPCDLPDPITHVSSSCTKNRTSKAMKQFTVSGSFLTESEKHHFFLHPHLPSFDPQFGLFLVLTISTSWYWLMVLKQC